MKRFRLVLAWVMMIGGIVLWPILALTIAKEEPQFTLGLSFMALVYASFNSIQLASDREPKIAVVLAWIMLAVSIVGWPLSLILLRDEPTIVLSLSWGALIYEAFNAIQIASDTQSRKGE